MPLIEIGSHNAGEFLQHIEDSGFKRGLIPRDFADRPEGYHAAMPSFPQELLIPEDEWPERLKQQQDAQASNYDLRNLYYDTLKSLDQDGLGLCWAFSSTKADMYARIRAGEPPLVLSPWYVAGKVKGWRDQGGSGDESAAFLASNGAPTMEKVPRYSSSYVNQDVVQDAAQHKITVWYDGTQSRDMNRKIMVSAFLLGGIPILDLNWLGHSMCGCRVVSLNPFVVDADNSWGEIGQFGEKGLYRLTGQHAIPDNVCVVFGSQLTA